VKVYVDPARGFVPLRIESGFSARNEAGEMLTHYGVRVINSELKQVSEALWVPVAAAVIHSRQASVPAQDRPLAEWTYRVLDVSRNDIRVLKVSFNEGLADEHFTFEFPKGTRVLDELTGVTVVIGGVALAMEDVIDDMVADAVTSPVAGHEAQSAARAAAPAGAAVPEPSAAAEATQEPSRGKPWWLAVALAVGVGAAALAVARARAVRARRRT
jgi:hypothetical protein